MFIAIVSINIIAIKLDDITVTFQFIRPKNPTIIITEKKQLEIVIVIQRIFLKTNHRVITINAKTPIPNTIIYFLINNISFLKIPKDKNDHKIL